VLFIAEERALGGPRILVHEVDSAVRALSDSGSMSETRAARSCAAV
jgi:hypothetical protein